MPTNGNLPISLYRRNTILRGLPLPHASLRQRHVFGARIHLASYRTSSATRSNSKLVVSGELEQFITGTADFNRLRTPGLAYFDKTEYIPVLQKLNDVLLLCRPRRFGKSLTVSMLQHFHGFEFRSEYNKLFKGLDVDEAVQKGTVQPGRYLVLAFDFSRVLRSHNMSQSTKSLSEEINLGLSTFQDQYAEYLGPSFVSKISDIYSKTPGANVAWLVAAVNRVLQGIHERGEKDNPLWDVKGIYMLADEYDAFANEFIDPHDPRLWFNAEPLLVLKAFWSTVKASLNLRYGIKKVYITGVTPVLLSDLVSGANNQANISFYPEVSTICGLTQSDVVGALRVVCNNEEEVQKRLKELEYYANGYHFCQEQSVDRVFNTQTALSYLEAVKRGRNARADNPENSEVSERFLGICARAPAAVNEMQSALQKNEHGQYQQILYEDISLGIKLSDLNVQSGGEGPTYAWQSLMVYMGGLTCDSLEPSKFLRIPNLVAAKRFGLAIIERLGSYQSVRDALHTFVKKGSPMEVLSGYCRLMRQRDVSPAAFRKTEENHRDSIWITTLDNPAIRPTVEYEVKKTTNRRGFVDLLVTNKNLYVLLEFKNIQIFYLGLDGEDSIDKAKQLEAMTLNQILGLEFRGDSFRTGTIRNWINRDIGRQLKEYVTGPTVKEEIADKDFRAFAVVIVGSRQILVREMDKRGNWVGEFQLARYASVVN